MARIRGIGQIDRNTNLVSDQLIGVESGTLDTLISTDGTQVRFVKEGTGALAYFESNKLLWTSSAGLTHVVGTNSVDGADTRTLLLSSSDSANAARGAFITLAGNEASVNPSSIFLTSGNATNSLISINATGSNGTIQLHSSNILRLTLTSGGSLEYNNNMTIHAASVDGADNQRIVINGGGNTGGIDPARGAGLQLSGNEESNPGLAQIFSGDAVGSKIQFFTPGNYPIRFWTNSTQRWDIDGSGHLVPASASAYNFGSASSPVNNVYATSIGLFAASSFSIFTNNINRWQVNSTGSFIPGASNTYDIGTDTSRVSRIYAQNELRVDAISKADADGVMSFASGTGALPYIKLQGTTGNKITAGTSDGADNTYVKLAGGGDVGSSRGATIELYGNEAPSSNNGKVLIQGGQDANGTIQLQTNNASAGINLTTGGNSANITLEGNSGGAKWLYVANDGELEFTGTTTGFIGTTTSDGADNASLYLSAGGGGAGTNASLPTRTGSLTLRGNENAFGGQVFLQGGAVASGKIRLQTNHATPTIDIEANTLVTWSFNSTGQLVQNATNGDNIIINRNGKGIFHGNNAMDLIFGDSTLGAFIVASGSTVSSEMLISTGPTVSGAALYLRAQGATAPILLQAGGATTRWSVLSSGHYVPFVGSTYDIGTTSLRVRNLYVDNIIGGAGGGSLSTLANDTFLNGRNFANSADVGLIKLSVADDTTISSASAKKIKLTNIAGSAYVGTFDYVNQSLALAATAGVSRLIQTSATIDSRWTLDPANSRTLIGNTTSHDLYFNTANLNRWYIDTTGRLAEDPTNGNGILLQNPTSGIEYNSASGDLYFGSIQSNDLRFYTNNSNRWRIKNTSGNLEQDATNGGDLVFNKSSGIIRQGTVDATDTNSISLVGGGAEATSRGSYIRVSGNEHADLGKVIIQSGAVAGADIRMDVGSNANIYQLSIGNTPVDQNSGTLRTFTTRDRPTVDGVNFIFNAKYPDITSTVTRYQKVAEFRGYDPKINVGITDSGYRIGIAVEHYFNTANFAGTLAEQYGTWSRVGLHTLNPTGTISNSYALYAETLNFGIAGSITNAWGIFQASNGGGNTKNYFEGRVGIGVAPATGFFLDVAGALQVAGNIQYTPSIFSIAANTADASDTKSITIAGGGASGASRGATLNLFGNEATNPGGTTLQTGDASGGNISLIVNNTTGAINHRFNGINQWAWNDAGETIFNSSTATIRSNTSDGTDNKYIIISGGGAAVLNDNSRGSQILLFGNENGIDAGGIRLVCGPSGGLSLSGTSTQLVDQGGNNILTHKSNELIYNINTSSFNIRASTADGADNKKIIIGGGGAAGFAQVGRGAYLELGGNESNSGGATLSTGDAGGHLYLYTRNSAADIYFNAGAIGNWKASGADGDLVFSGSTSRIHADTADGADTKRLLLCGGGIQGDSRGGTIYLYGNEHGSTGSVEILAGGAGSIYFETLNAVQWQVQNAGHLVPGSNNTKDIGNSSLGIRDIYLRDLLVRGAITGTATNTLNITTGTVDGTDNMRLEISGGGDIGSSRGAYISLFGNEEANTGRIDLVAGNVSGGHITISTAGAERWRIINSSNSNLQFSTTNGYIFATTSDGSDSARLILSGGGNVLDTARGGYITINGNEHAGLGGIQIQSGIGTAGVGINIQVNSTTGELNLGTNATTRLAIDANGRTQHRAFTGYTPSGKFEIPVVANTTNATTANLYTLTLADNTTYIFTVTLGGRFNSTTAKGIGGKLKFTVYRNNAGAAVIASDLGGRIKEIETYGSPGYDFDVDVSSNDIRIRITGAAAETVSWIGNIEYLAVSTAT